MFKSLNNFLPYSYVNEIKNIINSNNFNWSFLESIYTQQENFKINNFLITETPGLVHSIWEENFQSPYFDIVKVILFFLEKQERLNIKSIHRIRIRKTIQYPNHTLEKFNIPHVDLEKRKNYLSFIYYLHDSDGDTFLFNHTKESIGENYSLINNFSKKDILFQMPPKEGSGLLFNGNIYHSGNNPVNFIKRTIINFDFSII